MPPRKKRRPRDINQLAANVVADSIASLNVEAAKDADAVRAGKLGGTIGGTNRAKHMTPAERSASARKAATARWKKPR